MKAEIIIEGIKVHDIFNHVFLLRIAYEEGLSKFCAFNKAGKSSQEIVIRVEGTPDQIENVFNDIHNIRIGSAEAQNISIKTRDYFGKIPDLTFYTQYLMVEQLSKLVSTI
jgi:hypothetical protein